MVAAWRQSQQQAKVDDAKLIEVVLKRDHENDSLTLGDLAVVANEMFPDSDKKFTKAWAEAWWDRMKHAHPEIGLCKTLTIDEKTIRNYSAPMVNLWYVDVENEMTPFGLMTRKISASTGINIEQQDGFKYKARVIQVDETGQRNAGPS